MTSVVGSFRSRNTITDGSIFSGSSMLPERNDKTFSRPLLVLATSDPHHRQNILVMVLPLSAVWV